MHLIDNFQLQIHKKIIYEMNYKVQKFDINQRR